MCYSAHASFNEEALLLFFTERQTKNLAAMVKKSILISLQWQLTKREQFSTNKKSNGNLIKPLCPEGLHILFLQIACNKEIYRD